ncbi:transcription antitermination factor NusB [Candidatus Spongiihabitans sp.]|uniref:transcription antitermination factor NusB n=1 Tax=Candidatus Spongiihabitans sp. TaxID=3101308 RepID=UPI003C705C22
MARSGRHLARRCAVQALYQWNVTGQSPSEIESSFIKNENLSGRHLDYFLALIKNIPLNMEVIDNLITPHLDRKLDKVDLIDHAILRVGTYELKFQPDVPARVVLDEAIDIAKVFASEHSYKYVNGVLDKIAREVRGDV